MRLLPKTRSSGPPSEEKGRDKIATSHEVERIAAKEANEPATSEDAEMEAADRQVSICGIARRVGACTSSVPDRPKRGTR